MGRDASGLGRSILGKYPPSPRSGEQRREFPHGFRARVLLLDTVRLRTAAPLTEDEKMSRSILVHKQLMRHIALEPLHVRPDLSCETEPLCFGARIQPGFPDDGDYPCPRRRFSDQSVYPDPSTRSSAYVSAVPRAASSYRSTVSRGSAATLSRTMHPQMRPTAITSGSLAKSSQAGAWGRCRNPG